MDSRNAVIGETMLRSLRQRAARNSLLAVVATSGWSAASIFAPGHAQAAEQWQTSTVKHVYPLANADFVIVLDVDPVQCPVSGPGKYLYVVVGQNGMTGDGRKAMLAVALQALATRGQISVAYDDASAFCYVNRISAWAP